jgi:hypothetical protein
VWLEFDERVQVVVRFLQESPILAAHRYLCEPRPLIPRDLEHFTPLVTIAHGGNIPRDELEPEDAEALAQISPRVDPRLERVTSQQFVKCGVVRRDVRYEMAGATGTVALSGAGLLGASTPDALKPIHRRLIALAGAGVVSMLLASWLHSAFSRPTPYFATVNSWITRVALVGVVAAIVAASDTVRRLRPGFQWWPARRGELIAAGVLIAAFGSVPILALAGRPSVAEARAAVASGDLARAAVVVEALNETRTSPDVADVVGQLGLAEASALEGDARIAKLDEITGHGGPHASEAHDRAAQARLDSVRAALAARRPGDALAMLDRWTAELATTPGVRDVRAEALDQKVALCSDAVCSFLGARAADAASTSPPRLQALSAARQQLLAALEPKEASDADALRRVRALRSAATLGAAALAATPDQEIAAKSNAALSGLDAELSKVTLIGSSVALVDEVLDRPTPGSPLSRWQDLDGVAVFPAAVAGRCTGIYVVGAAAGSRSLAGKEAGVKRLLARATAQATAALQPPPASAKEHDTSRWVEGQTPVMARWKNGALMELRVGAATP